VYTYITYLVDGAAAALHPYAMARAGENAYRFSLLGVLGFTR
jgi:hypothetical protein